MVKLLIVSPNTKGVGVYKLINSESGEQITSTIAADPVAALCQINTKDYSSDVGVYQVMFFEEQSRITPEHLAFKIQEWEKYIRGIPPTDSPSNN